MNKFDRVNETKVNYNYPTIQEGENGIAYYCRCYEYWNDVMNALRGCGLGEFMDGIIDNTNISYSIEGMYKEVLDEVAYRAVNNSDCDGVRKVMDYYKNNIVNRHGWSIKSHKAMIVYELVGKLEKAVMETKNKDIYKVISEYEKLFFNVE